MRLWHYKLIPRLPRQQLLGQHRECCALRGKGWGRKHSTVDYVFRENYIKLYCYHNIVMDEMMERGYNINLFWRNITYRGRKIGIIKNISELPNIDYSILSPHYQKHNDTYLKECLLNLNNKGIIIDKELL